MIQKADLSSAELELAADLRGRIDHVAKNNEIIYRSKHLPNIGGSAVAGKGGVYLEQFVAYYLHRITDARAVLRNACKDLHEVDADMVRAAAIHAYVDFIESGADELVRQWGLEITGKTPPSGTAKDTAAVKNAFQEQGKGLRLRLDASKDWAVEELKHGLDEVLSQLRFDAYQKQSATATKEMVKSAKATANATIVIAFFTIVTAVAAGWQGWLARETLKQASHPEPDRIQVNTTAWQLSFPAAPQSATKAKANPSKPR